MTDFGIYQSPFTWRYGSAPMRGIWSEVQKRRLWRTIWLALAETQAEYDLVDEAQLADLRAQVSAVDVPRSLEIEAEIHHDLMAELQAYAEQCPVGGGALHLGATSADIEDNADALRLRQALDLILRRLSELLKVLCGQIETWADLEIIAFTHLQPAEPTTLGYRLAQYAQDLWSDWSELRRANERLRGKGFKGAVGTGASYADLIGVEHLEAFESKVMARLGLPAYPITTQTYPRKQEFAILSVLAGLGGSLYKFAFDLRLLQSPAIGELAEPFRARQVGSSAMPFKRNPIRSEKIDSLARLLAQLPRLAWDNAAHSLLERTLDDSANRRSMLAEAFLISDELLGVSTSILEGLRVSRTSMARNLRTYGPFAALEPLLMALAKAGADRQEMHENLRLMALQAWEAIEAGRPNPLIDWVSESPDVRRYLTPEAIRAALEPSGYVGDAPERARQLAAAIRGALEAAS